VAAQFFYVAAQTGVFSFLFNIPQLGSSRLLGLGGFGLFLTGRFIGSMVLRYFKAQPALRPYEPEPFASTQAARRIA